MLLTDKISFPPSSGSTEPDPESFLFESLGTIFPDDTHNQHGDPGATLIYASRFGPLTLTLADPGEGERKLFAHFLW